MFIVMSLLYIHREIEACTLMVNGVDMTGSDDANDYAGIYM